MDTETPKGGGIYRHFKGKQVEVLCVAKHSETLEEMVVYQELADSAANGAPAYWVRPMRMFTEHVQTNDGNVPRFAYVGMRAAA